MSTPTPAASVGNALLALIEGDVLTVIGPALLSFLTAEAAAKGDPLKMAAAYTALLGNLQPLLLTLENTVIGQLIAYVQAKLAAAIAAVPPLPPSS